MGILIAITFSVVLFVGIMCTLSIVSGNRKASKETRRKRMEQIEKLRK